MVSYGFKGKWKKRIEKIILMLSLLIFAGKASAYVLQLGKVVDNYSACSWESRGDGTSRLRVTVNYREGFAMGGYIWKSRGLLVYTYNAKGQVNPSGGAAQAMWLNDVYYGSQYSDASGYVMYHGVAVGEGGTIRPQWGIEQPFTARFDIIIQDSSVKDWPAVSLRAGNFTNGDDVGEITGGAYISRDGAHGSCNVVDPVVPPAPEIAINVTAPDWNLGELPAGNGEKVFSNSADQLCFSYSGAGVSGKNFIINASNANGQLNNRYRLRNLDDPTQEVPYDIKLDSGARLLNLPNVGNAALTLDSSGKTCFVPTFRTTVDKRLTPGDYSDVLTFTVVTKS
ncbi:hypothetical protein [Burkholderia sp. Ac-20353]|uniref:hypothetical protein n=1 Tax=Burkholderia sp. Ac-20353 TaxID=2703894 RepID=UPI00197B4B7E|nr:hypothetical protein [Burkholderia sp. Ac-20353]MBN3787648.1 hypothetical protein [Burkholderia sp. Ac-20353]